MINCLAADLHMNIVLLVAGRGSINVSSYAVTQFLHSESSGTMLHCRVYPCRVYPAACPQRRAQVFHIFNDKAYVQNTPKHSAQIQLDGTTDLYTHHNAFQGQISHKALNMTPVSPWLAWQAVPSPDKNVVAHQKAI